MLSRVPHPSSSFIARRVGYFNPAPSALSTISWSLIPVPRPLFTVHCGVALNHFVEPSTINHG